ncbi:hypothetical protein [Stenotrophomonas sp. 24(2023)]|uniref:hypothetical protein n=1 Tax=Stenotrophomonas sp. 24(2023) TaxID=3068324 RepID=UPI0027DEB0F3|nr:hypothetical protein [Stenotrophomonas sp. 24(2023)]WMJ69425.1 hypothetical protein Q9R17_19975 [Stenotrophomonas sp. 24(2023)]
MSETSRHGDSPLAGHTGCFYDPPMDGMRRQADKHKGVRWRPVLNLVALAMGTCAAGVGLLLVALAISGHAVQGRTGVYMAAATALLLSTPLLAFPFSRGVAKKALLLVLAALAGFALWVSFWPQEGVIVLPRVQAAAIAFAVLLAFRIYLGRGRGSTPHR